jgi:hypothetical protein
MKKVFFTFLEQDYNISLLYFLLDTLKIAMIDIYSSRDESSRIHFSKQMEKVSHPFFKGIYYKNVP